MRPQTFARAYPFFISFFGLLLSGCGGASSPTSGNGASTTPTVPPLLAGGATTAYIFKAVEAYDSTGYLAGQSTVSQISVSASGSVTPTNSFTVPLDFFAGSVAFDPLSNTIYVGGFSVKTAQGFVLAYPAGSSGTVAPTRTIALPLVGPDYYEPASVAVDQTGQLYVLANPTTNITGIQKVFVYASSASGSDTPVRSFNAGDYQGYEIALDSSGDVYLASYAANAVIALNPVQTGFLFEFSPTASGDATPLLTIYATNSIFSGIAVDSERNIYATRSSFTSVDPAIVEYAPGASGAATPIKTISGAATSFQNRIGNIRLDSKGNIYTWTGTGTSSSFTVSNPSLLVFGPSASGNAQPAISITSPAWLAGSSIQIR